MSDPAPARPWEVMVPALLERRAWVRFATDLAASCRALDVRQEVGWPGRVGNLSAGGLALLLRRRFRAGLPLVVEIRNAAGTFQCSLRARIVHVQPVRAEDDRTYWLTGCAFVRPLGGDELRAVLDC
jgi:hypothetical protein